MSNRKRNMLEAFQASAQEAQGEHVPHTKGGSGGPFAEESRRSPAAGAEGAAEPRRAGEPKLDAMGIEVPSLAQAMARLPLGPIAGVQLLLLALVFWLGYLSAGAKTVEASDGNRNGEFTDRGDTRNFGGRPNTATAGGNSNTNGSTADSSGGAGNEESMTPYDREFFAAWETGLTLRVASYDRTPQNENLAWTTYDYLREQGLPVVLPVKTSKYIFIFVGTAKRSAELTALRERLANLAGSRQEYPFRDAFVTNIKDYYMPR